MGEIVKQILSRPIQLADQITKAAEDTNQFRPECLKIQAQTKKLAELFCHAMLANIDHYERPMRRIIDITEQNLLKAFGLVDKCRERSILKRMFKVTNIPNNAFRKILSQLENSIEDITWLLLVSDPCRDDADDDDDIAYIEYFGPPPIARNDPFLCLIWEQVANLSSSSLEKRSDAAAQLVSMTRENDRYARIVIEEGGVGPLLKLAKEGKPEGQEHAVRVIGIIGRDLESVEQIVKDGVMVVFAKILKDWHIKAQAVVAWAVSELAAHYPKCQDYFAQNGVLELLVNLLESGTFQEHKMMSIRTVVLDSKSDPRRRSSHDHDNDKQAVEAADQMNTQGDARMGKSSQKTTKNNSTRIYNHSVLRGLSVKGKEYEDPITKAEMKAMVARALRYLAKGNNSICCRITDSKALLCFAVLLEKGDDKVKYNSAMALMEITSVAEENKDLLWTVFKPTSPAAKAVVDQLVKALAEEKSRLLVPCSKSLGNLARTFRGNQARIINPLVKLLEDKKPEVMFEALMALTKFACSENVFHAIHCKSIIAGGGHKHLSHLVYYGEQFEKIPSLILLCQIALNVPESRALAEDDVVVYLQWGKMQSHLMKDDPKLDEILPQAIKKLEGYFLYQCRGRKTLEFSSLGSCYINCVYPS